MNPRILDSFLTTGWEKNYIVMRAKVPSIEQCYELLKKYNVPDHIIQHSEIVCNVAVFLAHELNKKGEDLSISEIQAAALLHDVTKMEGIEKHQDHAKTGKELLLKDGFPRIGEIVGEHVKLRKERNSQPLSEEEIVNYSDKRVMHTNVVSLEERFTDIRKRYGLRVPGKHINERLALIEYECSNLEKKIFTKLDFGPEELSDVMKTSFFKKRD